MIVADTNLVVHLLLPVPESPHAERVRAKEKVWAVPQLLQHELLNVLAQFVKRGDFDRDTGARIYRRGLAMVDLSLLKPDPVAVLQMAARSGCSTYDIEYVWLATELGVPLLTSDKKVLAAFPDKAVHPAHFS